MTVETIRGAFSLCPVCYARIPASYEIIGDDVYMKKTCREHGNFKTVTWRGIKDNDMRAWGAPGAGLSEGQCPPCPDKCGLCDAHIQDTCCIILEVTERCNLNCTYCLAGDRGEPETPPLETIKGWISFLAQQGKSFIQLSGGEPTLRDDLPEIVRFAAQCGFEYIQLNSNGIRLAEDENYVRRLAEAGLSFVFMQFDGTNDDIYLKLRGRPLYSQKRKAVDVCAKYNLGVTFVSTVVPGVNDDNIGRLISLAVSLSPMVRGVHLHPVGYIGRFPSIPGDDMRITLPELLRLIEKQTQRRVTREDFSASGCDHPLCGFHGAFVVMPEGLRSLKPLPGNTGCCAPPAPNAAATNCSPGMAEKSQRFVGRRWKRRTPCCETRGKPADISTLEGFLARVASHGFTITAMAFQDSFNVDLERLRQCSLHVYSDGKIMPLCVRYGLLQSSS